MCVQDFNLTEHEVVQLVKDYTTEHVHGAVEYYLNMNDWWSYAGLIEHLRTSFELGETYSSLLSDLYARCQNQRKLRTSLQTNCRFWPGRSSVSVLTGNHK